MNNKKTMTIVKTSREGNDLVLVLDRVVINDSGPSTNKLIIRDYYGSTK